MHFATHFVNKYFPHIIDWYDQHVMLLVLVQSMERYCVLFQIEFHLPQYNWVMILVAE